MARTTREQASLELASRQDPLVLIGSSGPWPVEET